ncbi:putative ATP-dependent RNA helicase TDRD12 [Cydia amplana]|uniref:putative ATP-dependent RNA helicase TDRD12 n=1 Tax=Cydia amplana TaxID=1869771 RepID=UPI002FE62F54
MEPDCYLVEVIHYLNPHLIWVRNPSTDTMEQIGVYGVVPLDKELMLDTQEIETKLSNTWMQAATYVMMKVFMEATAVWFQPIYIHRRTSIFDTNIHKYGELLIEKQDGRKRKLSSYLRKSETALYDDAAFHQQLSSGLIQTKLTKTETDEVMKVITSKLKDYESVVSFQKQTEVYQVAKKLEALTTENLNKHNSRLKKNMTNKDIVNVLDRKFKDLQLCKDLDDEPQGRATKKTKTSESNSSSRLDKLKKLSAQNNVAKYDDYNYAKAENNKAYDDYNDSKGTYSQNIHGCQMNVDEGTYSQNSHGCQMNGDEGTYSQKSHGYQMNVAEPKKMAALPDEGSVTKKYESIERFESFQPRRNSKNKKYKTSTNKPSEYDVKTHMRIAYSPPGVDKSKLALKIVPIQQESANETYKVDKEDDTNVMNPKDYTNMMKHKDDMYGEVDSNVNITITNKDVLKKYNNLNESKSEGTENQINSFAKYNDTGRGEQGVTEQNNEEKAKSDVSSSDGSALTSKLLQKRLNMVKIMKKNSSSSSNTTSSSGKVKEIEGSSTNTTSKDSDDDEVNELIEKYTASLKANAEIAEKKDNKTVDLVAKKNNVNPFQNVDPNLSVFVDKLVKPVLMVHTKNNSRIEPLVALSDIPFNAHVHNVLRNMNVDQAMTMQSVSWLSVLRGFSTFLIGPQACGKTMGYLPSICRLISDFDNDIVNSVGPTCIIVAATAQSVSDIEFKCRMLLGTKETIFSCYAGMDLLKITTSLLNGCNLFICTPCVLVRLLLQTDFGLDLRRLTTFVLDDCERLEEVYKSEIKIALSKIKHMLKARVNKEVKVQYILASRVWCDFMEPLAKKAPNTVVCIGAFQECVLYSKANTTVDFVKPENKVAKVLEFVQKMDKKKKTIVVCRTDEEVIELEKVLKEKHAVVYACNDEMTVEDLRNFNITWDQYADPTIGPILVCCDGNLSHMNITDAHNLVHYSMPELFSRFCKRFSVLNDNYPSIFKDENESVAIRIIIEESNAEQLPKICNFIKRCTKEFPRNLDVICKEILTKKDMVKAANLVPICGNLLALGDCPDFWYCRERHTSSEIHDEPKEWMPTDGVITFRILHYQSAVTYSVRLLSNIKKGGNKKYPQTYSTLSFKMGTYFSQESNKKLLGVPKIGDVCAVAINQDFYVRCQVVDIINKYRNGLPNHVLIKLIDEEKLETTRDIYLYHLPKEFRDVETYVAQVSLAGVLPKDKDITFSELAKNHIKKGLEKNESLYMRGKVVLTIGNRIFVDNIDVCQDLTSMNEVVVKNNFKEMLSTHSEVFPDHIKKIKSRLFAEEEITMENTDCEQVEDVKPVKEPPKVQWAHLNREDMSLVYFTSAIDPSTFFVRLVKFKDTMDSLCKDIKKYTEDKPEPLREVKEKDVVLAKFPDNKCYERAQVDCVEGNKAKCFFVDYGDWREVPLKDLTEIPDKFVLRLPFQAIECRLLGVKPVGDAWTDFSTNWLCDRCDVEDDQALKRLYVQYYSTDKAKFTGGNKYAVALIDTNNDCDVVYNTQMINHNLAAPDENEIEILNNINFIRPAEKGHESNDEEDWSNDAYDKSARLTNKPIRSVSLVEDSDTDSDRWSVNMPDDIVSTFKPDAKSLEMPKIKSDTSSIASSNKIDNDSVTSEFEVVKKLQIKELDSDDLSTSESASITEKPELIKEAIEGRKPKLLWRQNKTTVTVKIMLVGAENYELKIQERELNFSADIYDTIYNFKINLYGIVDKNKSTHDYKGQYILVKLFKVMHKSWLTLTKEPSLAKWIVYDHDSIDTSSEEEDAIDDSIAKVIENNYREDSDSDSCCDDLSFNYPR